MESTVVPNWIQIAITGTRFQLDYRFDCPNCGVLHSMEEHDDGGPLPLGAEYKLPCGIVHIKMPWSAGYYPAPPDELTDEQLAAELAESKDDEEFADHVNNLPFNKLAEPFYTKDDLDEMSWHHYENSPLPEEEV
jgi:hypothetical protein